MEAAAKALQGFGKIDRPAQYSRRGEGAGPA